MTVVAETTPAPHRRDRTKSVRRWALVLGFGALGATAIWLRARGPRVATISATRSDLEGHVVASGRVMPPARITVAPNVSGLVVAVGALEGQHVKKGDLLVQIDDAEERAALAQSQAAVNQASAKVDQLRRVGAIVANESLREAEANLTKATADLERAKALAASHSVPTIEVDDAEHALAVARAQRNSAEAQQIASTPMGADSRVALTSLLAAQAALTGAQVRLAETRLTAAHDGVVLTRSVEVGDTAQPGKTLMTMATDGEAELVFEPDERNLASIALGERARASADAFPQDILDAEVSYIAPSIDPARGTVEVRLRVSKAPAYLRPDMTVSIDLTVASKKNVLVVRSDAVHALASPSPWVLVAADGRAVRHEVKTGIAGEGSTEIISGIEEGAEVIVPSGDNVKPGDRVRPVRAEP